MFKKVQRRRLLFLLAVTVLAAIPRFVGLGAIGFSLDELSDVRDADRYLRSPHWLLPISDGYQNGQLPFFLMLLLRADPEHGRFLSALFGVAGVTILSLITMRKYGDSCGAICGILFALSPFHISASRLAYSHGHILSSPFLLAALAFVFGAKDITKIRPRDIFFAGGLLGLALGTDLLAIFCVAAFAVLLGLNMRNANSPTEAGKLILLAYLGFLIGLAIASPMYLASPDNAWKDIATRMARWNSVRGFLWLGEYRETIPASYYPIVIVVKLAPTLICLLLLSVRVAVRRKDLHFLFCGGIFTLALVALSLRLWKTPFYLVPFLPLLYLGVAPIVADALRRSAGKQRWVVSGLLGITMVWQIHALSRSYPDYLMLGRQYHPALFGEFQGPAVSHGQWIANAVEFVSKDAGTPARAVFPIGVFRRQFEHYGPPNGVLAKEFDGDRETLKASEYVIIPVDTRLLYVPYVEESAALNRLLLNSIATARQTGAMELVATMRCNGQDMVEIYRVANPIFP